jgi:kinetochore protein Mis12/MTW1
LETLLENGVDKRFDAFELYVLRNILVVPQDLVGWVRLAHHKNLDFTSITPPAPTDPNSSEPTANMPALPPAHEAQSRLRTLRQTLLASHALNQTLQSEVSSNERTLTQLRALASSDNKSPFSFINSTSMSTKELKDTASFAISQIGLIRSLIAQLKPKYAELQRRRQKEQEETSGDRMDVDEETEKKGGEGTPEEERKKYIERMTRRHMESSRGLRLNAKGEVVGGDFEENVARKGLGEVEELEGLVEGLGEGDP